MYENQVEQVIPQTYAPEQHYPEHPVEQPPVQEPLYQQPIYQQPPIQQPVYQQPPVQQPVYQQPPVQQPVYQQPPVQQPVYQQPPVQQPVYQQPPVQQPVYQQPVCQQNQYPQPPYPYAYPANQAYSPYNNYVNQQMPNWKELEDSSFGKALTSVITSIFPIASIVGIVMGAKGRSIANQAINLAKQYGISLGGKTKAAAIMAKAGMITSIVFTAIYGFIFLTSINTY